MEEVSGTDLVPHLASGRFNVGVEDEDDVALWTGRRHQVLWWRGSHEHGSSSGSGSSGEGWLGWLGRVGVQGRLYRSRSESAGVEECVKGARGSLRSMTTLRGDDF